MRPQPCPPSNASVVEKATCRFPSMVQLLPPQQLCADHSTRGSPCTRARCHTECQHRAATADQRLERIADPGQPALERTLIDRVPPSSGARCHPRDDATSCRPGRPTEGRHTNDSVVAEASIGDWRSCLRSGSPIGHSVRARSGGSASSEDHDAEEASARMVEPAKSLLDLGLQLLLVSKVKSPQ